MPGSNVFCLLLVTACTGLVGCGGSDGQLLSAPVSASTPPDSAAALAEPTENVVANRTADLKSTSSFEFKTQWELHVDFDIADARNSQGFLSLCSDYEFDGESAYQINYDKCALRAAIDNGRFNSSVNVTNDVTDLLAVVWFNEAFRAPLFLEFEIDNGQQLISWY